MSFVNLTKTFKKRFPFIIEYNVRPMSISSMFSYIISHRKIMVSISPMGMTIINKVEGR